MALEHIDTAADLLTDRRQAQDEFTIQLVDAVAPPVLQGFCSMLKAATALCKEQGEEEKYLMAFQNMLARIPGWNTSLITKEVERITDISQIGYLPDLVVGVHIIHLRIMSSVRVGHGPKRIEIDPPDFNKFVHRVYCEAGRKMWTYAYLFRKDVSDLEHQRNMHECEKIVRECVVAAVRSSMPVETILRAYIDEAEEIRVGSGDGVGAETGSGAGTELGKAAGDGSVAVDAATQASTDVESELKQITVTELPGAPAEAQPAGAQLGGAAEEPPTPKLKLAGESEPDAGLSVGFASTNEVLDMETNKTAPIEMSHGTRSPAALPGPALEEVTLQDLVSSSSRPLSSDPAIALGAATTAATAAATATEGLEDVTLGVVPAGSRPPMPTIKLDTTPW